MKIYTQIIGNTASPHWAEATQSIEKEYIDLDHWSAQKSRLVATGSLGNTYAISLDRGRRLSDGDIIYYSAEEGRAVVIRISLDEVMVATLDPERMGSVERLLTSAVELGHALGNQHWPAVVRGAQVFVPMSIDRKVMDSVLAVASESLGERISPALYRSLQKSSSKRARQKVAKVVDTALLMGELDLLCPALYKERLTDSHWMCDDVFKVADSLGLDKSKFRPGACSVVVGSVSDERAVVVRVGSRDLSILQ